MYMSQLFRDPRGMGLYSHYTVDQLSTLRDSLMNSLHARLTAPTQANSNGREVRYQQSPDAIRKELQNVTAEIARRSGQATRGPIYLV